MVIQNAHLYRRLQESAAQLEAKVRERTAELEATYRELESSHARLREVDQLKSDFLGNVSHELRTPAGRDQGLRRQPAGRRRRTARRQAPPLPRPRPRQRRPARPHGVGPARPDADRGREDRAPAREPCRSPTSSPTRPRAFATSRRSARVRVADGSGAVPAGVGGSGQGAPGPDQPPRERHQVQPAGRPGGGHGAARASGTGALRGPGHRPRHPAGRARARVRQVLPGRPGRGGAAAPAPGSA